MSSIWGRILTAGVLSLGVFGASQYLAEQIRPKTQPKETRKPIASIEELNDGVEKRSASSLVWKVTSQGEDLHPGEAIKTLESGEVRIQFKGSSKYIDLDPESLIVLTQENGNEIALELMDGSALIGQKEKSQANEPALTLKLADGNVDLTQATVQLSKSETGSVDVQVIQGETKSALAKPLAALKIISPSLISPVDLQTLNSENIRFQWSGFPEKSQVSLWLGKSRKSLKELASTEKDYLETPLGPGSYAWKLVAKNPETGAVLRQSAIFRLKIFNSKKLEPSPVPVIAQAPKVETPAVVAPPPPPEVQISWLGDANSSRQHFTEIPRASFSWTTDQQDQVKSWRFKLVQNEEELKTKPLFLKETKESSLVTPVPKAGRYLAQVEALDEKNQVLAVSELRSVEVSPLPLLKAPEFQPTVGDFKADLEGRVDLQWTAVPEAKEYWITLMDSNGVELRKAKYKGLSTALLSLLPGEYKISVHAIDSFGRTSAKNPPRTIQVPDSSGLQAPKLKKIQVN